MFAWFLRLLAGWLLRMGVSAFLESYKIKIMEWLKKYILRRKDEGKDDPL